MTYELAFLYSNIPIETLLSNLKDQSLKAFLGKGSKFVLLMVQKMFKDVSDVTVAFFASVT